MNPIEFLTGIGGKILAGIALAGMIGYGVHCFEGWVRAEDEVSAKTAEMAQMQSDTQHIVGGLRIAAAANATRSAQNAAIMGAINAAKPSTCPVPDSLLAVMDGRRVRAAGANDAGTKAPGSK